jgi:A nuclease family of the HNH/ENDO VII superfamily with conserved AHH
MALYDAADPLLRLTNNSGFSLLQKGANFFANLFPGGSWQGHHIIPVELIDLQSQKYNNTAAFLRTLTTEGLFSIRDGVQNNIFLPSDQPTANKTGLALHSGSHGVYSEQVAGLIDKIAENGATVGASDRPSGQIRTERSRHDGEMTPVYRLLLAEQQYS